MALAQEEGYFRKSPPREGEPNPLHGYYYKILQRQGKHAPGGKYNYVINDNMIGGFALLAWPAAHGDSGVMSVIVNQQGRVFQTDLGKDTTRKARRLTTYDPDSSWQLSPD